MCVKRNDAHQVILHKMELYLYIIIIYILLLYLYIIYLYITVMLAYCRHCRNWILDVSQRGNVEMHMYQ